MAEDHGELITLADAATRAGISARRLRQYAASEPPRLKTVSIGSAGRRPSILLTRWEWVEECLASRAKPAPPPPADPDAAVANKRAAWRKRKPSVPLDIIP